MNIRKFYFIISCILSLFLFVAGAFLLTQATSFLGDPDENSVSLFKDIVEPFKLSGEAVNVLIMGGDKVNKNTDTIMLVNYNPSTARINLMSIPRDTKADVKGSSLPKINSAYPAGGGKLAVDTVSKLLNVKIKYYVFIDTAAFKEIIDLLGGVDYNIPVDMNYDDPTQNLHIHLKKGQQHLDGSKAEQFMRFRQPTQYNNEIMKFYDGSDLKRIEAQQSFIREVIRQKTSVRYLTRLNSIIKAVFDNLETNLTLNEALKMSYNIGKINADEVEMFRLPGESKDEGGWFYIHDKVKTGEIIKQYFSSNSGYSANTNIRNNTDSTEKINKTPQTPKPGNENIDISPSKPVVKEQPEVQQKPNFTENNPSNNHTGITGISGEAP